MTPPAHVFVCPPLDGPLTGGTLYNARLLRALTERGVSARAMSLDETAPALSSAARAVSLDEAAPALSSAARAVSLDETAPALSSAARAVSLDEAAPARRSGRAHYWVDSLYLEHLPPLRRESDDAGSLGLLAHYLPSLVALGRPPRRAELSAAERAALDAADCFLSPSGFMRDVLVGVGVAAARIVTIEPGFDLEWEPFTGRAAADTCGATKASRPFSALMVANLVPGKGVAPFLRALDAALGGASLGLPVVGGAALDGAPLALSVVGSPALDDDYAIECREAVAAGPCARRCVRLEGALPHHALLERLAGADVLVSASRMESFGMALGEARALGVPILARAGGNAASLVGAASGGEVCVDDAHLARALVALALDEDERRARAELARRHRIRRSWADAAADLVAATRGTA